MKQETKQTTRKERVLTTNDLVFKKVFASPQNSHILAGFINDILDLNVTDVSIEDTYNIKTYHGEDKKPKRKYTQVDVLARLKGGQQVVIEMQVCGQQLFKERALFYLAEVYGRNYGNSELEDIKERYTVGERYYSALRSAYGIYIMVDNVFIDDDAPINLFEFYNKKRGVSLESASGEPLMSLVFLELKKTSSEMKKNIKAWFDYFKTGEVAKDAPKYLQEACQVAKYQNLNKEERDMISARQRAEDAALAREDYVWDSGKAEGKAEIIGMLYSNGMNIEEIATMTKMGEKEIAELIGITKE